MDFDVVRVSVDQAVTFRLCPVVVSFLPPIPLSPFCSRRRAFIVDENRQMKHKRKEPSTLTLILMFLMYLTILALFVAMIWLILYAVYKLQMF